LQRAEKKVLESEKKEGRPNLLLERDQNTETAKRELGKKRATDQRIPRVKGMKPSHHEKGKKALWRGRRRVYPLKEKRDERKFARNPTQNAKKDAMVGGSKF